MIAAGSGVKRVAGDGGAGHRGNLRRRSRHSTSGNGGPGASHRFQRRTLERGGSEAGSTNELSSSSGRNDSLGRFAKGRVRHRPCRTLLHDRARPRLRLHLFDSELRRNPGGNERPARAYDKRRHGSRRKETPSPRTFAFSHRVMGPESAARLPALRLSVQGLEVALRGLLQSRLSAEG